MWTRNEHRGEHFFVTIHPEPKSSGGGEERLTYLVYRRKMQMNIKPENDTRILIAFEVTKTSARKNSKNQFPATI